VVPAEPEHWTHPPFAGEIRDRELLKKYVLAERSLARSGKKGAKEERDVGRALGHPAHEVAVPLLAEGDVDAHLVAAVGDALLLVGADAVEHLVLEGLGLPPGPASQCRGDLDEPRIVVATMGYPSPA
jgi:hypothetical protein